MRHLALEPPRVGHTPATMRRAAVCAALMLVGIGDATASAAGPQTRRDAAPEVLPHVEAVSVSSGLAHSVISSSVPSPVSVTGLPDGRAAVLEKGGRVRLIVAGVLQPTPALQLSVCSQSERGLLGLAVDPQFQSTGYVYVYYTRAAAGVIGGCVNRVSRFTLSGTTISPASEVVLLDNIGSPNGNHNGGDLEVGNDGFLYVAVGDGGCDPRDAGQTQCAGSNDAAQDLSLLNGKILRIDRVTGAPAAGNPFLGAGTAVCRTRGNGPSTPTTICREIFAYGLRNPWRFAFDYDTGATRFFINDVGQNTREEINLGVLGANYGWPTREGLCPQGVTGLCAPPGGGLTDPITDYTHLSGDGEYITGAAFVPDGAWDELYDGGYLFADGNPGDIYLRLPNGNYGSIADGLGGIADIGFVIEGGGWALYYVNPATDTVGRITDESTAAPVAPDLTFVPTAPALRAFDSRALGADTGMLRAGSTRLINVAEADAGHRAALVNLTSVGHATAGHLVAWEPRTPRPATSALNITANQVVANAAIVPVDADGNILIYTAATTHLIVDVMGTFDTTAGTAEAGRLVPTGPIRAVDTRKPVAGENLFTRSTIPNGSFVEFDLAGRFGVDPTASAAVVIVTALASASAGGGDVRVSPGGGPAPATSAVNVAFGGDVRANLVVTPLGVDGSVDLRMLGNTAHVIVDVVGYFTGVGASTSAVGLFTLSPGTRPVDTRQNLPFGRRPANVPATIDPPVVPAEALAVAHNLTVVAPSAAGHLTAYPAGGTVPNVSNLNVTGAGQTRCAMAITSLGTGSVGFLTVMATELLVDVTGWFQGPIGTYSVDSLPE